MIEVTHNKQPQKKWPVFGVFSIASPLFGIPLAYLLGLAANRSVFQDPDNPEVWAGVAVFVHLSLFVILTGIVSGIIALLRIERLKILPLLGLLVNVGGAILWFHLFAPPSWSI